MDEPTVAAPAEAPPIDEMDKTALRAEIEASGMPAPAKATRGELAAMVEHLRARAAVAEPPDDAEDTAEVPPELADEVSTAIALREEAVAPVSALPTPSEFNASMAVANAIANSNVVPEVYRGKPDDVLAAVLFGREIGLGPMTALRDIYMIEGRAALAAHRQLALIRKGGVVILESEATAERCYIKARRSDTGEVMDVEFTMDDARQIKRGNKPLTDGANWKNYPADMLWARTVGRLTRRLGPDLLNGLPPYVAEEVADFSGWGADYNAEGELSVRARADKSWIVPADWPTLAGRFATVLGPEEAAVWMGEIATKGYAHDRISAIVSDPEVPDDRKADLWKRLCGALHAFEEQGEIIFRDDHRALVASTLAKAFDDAIQLEGPPWSLAPSEADERPQKADVVVDGEEHVPDADGATRANEGGQGTESDEVAGEVVAVEEELLDSEGNPIGF